MNQIDFQSTPAIGTVLMLGNQEYELVGSAPHVRKDGTATTLLMWKTNCPTCGTEFGVTTGLVSKNLNRRCASHRSPLKPVSGKRKRVKTKVVGA